MFGHDLDSGTVIPLGLFDPVSGVIDGGLYSATSDVANHRVLDRSFVFDLGFIERLNEIFRDLLGSKIYLVPSSNKEILYYSTFGF